MSIPYYSYVFTNDICNALGIHDATLRKWRRENLFPDPDRRTKPNKWRYQVFYDWLLEESRYVESSKMLKKRWSNLWLNLSEFEDTDIPAKLRLMYASAGQRPCCVQATCCPKGDYCPGCDNTIHHS